MHAPAAGHPHHRRAADRAAGRAAEPAAWPALSSGAGERHYEREQAMTAALRPARPHGAPAYYLGRPGSWWIAAAAGLRRRPSGPPAAGR